MNHSHVSVVIPTNNRHESLKRLLKSLKNSFLLPEEVIIINNASQPISLQKYPFPVKIQENKKNLGLATARTQGAKLAQHEYILFIDDDNEVHSHMIEKMLEGFENPEIIGVGPLTYHIYDKTKMAFLASRLQLWSSRAVFDRQILAENRLTADLYHTEILHNCFMVRAADGESVQWFDAEIFLGGTEFDFFQRLYALHPGKKCATHLQSLCYHDIPPREKDLLGSLGYKNIYRAYYFQRNRGVFVGKYGTFLEKCIFGIFFYPFFYMVYLAILLWSGRLDYARAHTLGTWDGYARLLFPQMRNVVQRAL